LRRTVRRLRPLVEEERRRQENERARIESDQTRKRLNALEKTAAEFMRKYSEDADVSREPNGHGSDSQFRLKGYSLNPPFAQIVLGRSARFSLNIRLDAFPEFAAGDIVQVSCVTGEITASVRSAKLEPHPTQDGVIRAVWSVTAEKPTKATGVRATIGSITAESLIEVLAEERDLYTDVNRLCFGCARYSVVVGRPKAVRVLAPCPSLVREKTAVEIASSSAAFAVAGNRVLLPHPELGVAICTVRISADRPDQHGFVGARLGDQSCKADLVSIAAPGAPISICLESVNYGNQRSRWKSNILSIAALHPSVQRYLGRPPDFPGQEQKHFRVLLAEIVAEAVCSDLLSKNIEASPKEYEDADWEAYYATYCKYMTEFLLLAHESQVPDPL
jgi:hypothetical protein